ERVRRDELGARRLPAGPEDPSGIHGPDPTPEAVVRLTPDAVVRLEAAAARSGHRGPRGPPEVLERDVQLTRLDQLAAPAVEPRAGAGIALLGEELLRARVELCLDLLRAGGLAVEHLEERDAVAHLEHPGQGVTGLDHESCGEQILRRAETR